MKKMAILFLIIGLVSLTISTYFFTRKDNTNPTVLTEQQSSSEAPVKKELSKEDVDNINKQKGNDFEDYIIQLLAKQNDVKFVGKVSDYHKNGVSALENFEPDLKFKHQNTLFAVECKWRNSFKNDQIYWAENRQIENYKNYQKNKKEKVFVAIGIGGNPSLPEKLYLVPLAMLKLEYVYQNYIKDFEVKNQSDMIGILKRELK